MEIKSLAQLKRVLADGNIFEIVEHGIHKDYTGQLRKVNVMQANGMYTIIPDDPDHKISVCNYGKGSWLEFGKAKNWKFHDGICEQYKESGELIWKIRVLERKQNAYLKGDIRMPQKKCSVYKKYMVKAEVKKDHGCVVTETKFFDSKEEVVQYCSGNNVNIEVIFELVQQDLSEFHKGAENG